MKNKNKRLETLEIIATVASINSALINLLQYFGIKP